MPKRRREPARTLDALLSTLRDEHTTTRKVDAARDLEALIYDAFFGEDELPAEIMGAADVLVPTLVDTVRAGHDGAQSIGAEHYALRALQHLSACTGMLDSLHTYHTIQLCVERLASTHDSILRSATRALQNFAFDRRVLQMDIGLFTSFPDVVLEAGAAAPLVRLLSPGSFEQTAEAARHEDDEGDGSGRSVETAAAGALRELTEAMLDFYDDDANDPSALRHLDSILGEFKAPVPAHFGGLRAMLQRATHASHEARSALFGAPLGGSVEAARNRATADILFEHANADDMPRRVWADLYRRLMAALVGR